MGPTDDNGIMGGLDFGKIKAKFRKYLDDNYDHRLLLNVDDPLVVNTYRFYFGALHGNNAFVARPEEKQKALETFYPGCVSCEGDPTVENFTMWVAHWAQENFPQLSVRVNVQETNTNGAEVGF